MKTRITAILMAAFLLLCSVGCNSSNDDTLSGGSETDSDGTTETEEVSLASFLPEGLNYGDKEYSILYAQDITGAMNENEITYLFDDIKGGDIVAEAVYERTKKCEEQLGIKIVSEHIQYDALYQVLADSALADTGDFEAVCGRLSSLASAVADGYLYNLKNITTLDLSHPWWDKNVNESMTLGTKQYIISGDLNYYDDYSILSICFNKNKFTDRGIEYPYQTVRDGKWTFDVMYSSVNDAAVDLDGNGDMDEKDFYGFVFDTGFLACSLLGFGETLAKSDGDTVTLNQSESMINKAMTLAEKFLNNESVCVKERKLGYEKGDTIFPNGNSLFGSTLVGTIVNYRELMEDDFGILPYPKYDESQKEYYSPTSHHWASAVAVPVNCKDLDTVGYVLDTLGCFSPDTVTEAVIGKNVETRSSRDEESIEMLKLIFSAKVFDASMIYNWGVYNIWTALCAETNPSITSTLESKAKSINKTISSFMEKVELLS